MEKVHAKVGELEQVFAEVASQAEVVYQEYKKALAALGAEPLPLPEPAEGSQVILQLLNWLLSEFEGLGEVMSVANDNAASVSFEGLVGNLLHAGAVDLSKLEGGFQYVPYEGLSEEVNRIQDVKMAYFERFWEPSGKVAVRTLAAALTGVSLLSAGSAFFFLLSCGKTLLFVQELIPDQPSGGGGTPEASRSPSRRDANGSPRAQV